MGKEITLFTTSFIPLFMMGIRVTIPLTLLSFFLGLILAMLSALARVAKIPLLQRLASFYVWIFRGTPLLVQLYILFFGLPSVGIVWDAFTAATIGFSLNVGAYASETLRAAILAVPKGQWEAGYSVGMTYGQTLRRIVLPQACKIAFPPLFNHLIGLTKDTSMAAAIALPEMFLTAQRIAARTFEPLLMYGEVALIYLLFCSILNYIQHWGEKKWKLH